MKIATICFTTAGKKISRSLWRKIQMHGDECVCYVKMADAKDETRIKAVTGSLEAWTSERFKDSDALIFIGAMGIAVRTIAPFIKDKYTDPAVLVIDEKGSYVIPVLSSHVGGGAELAAELAEELGAIPVITTATDVQKKFAVDVFAAKNGLYISSKLKAKYISADILNGKEIPMMLSEHVFLEEGKKLPEGLLFETDPEKCRVIVDYHRRDKDEEALHLIPMKMIWLGIGCKRGTPAIKIEEAIRDFLKKHDLHPKAIAGIASVDLKADEEGLLNYSEVNGVRFETFSPETLMAVPGCYSMSEFVIAHTGVDNVCERAAMCAAYKESPDGALVIVHKTKYQGITLAAAAVRKELRL